MYTPTLPRALAAGWPLLLLVVLYGSPATAQRDQPPEARPPGDREGTIKGYVRDAANGETLIGATVQVDGQGVGTTTNVYGFYSLTLPDGAYELVVSYLGYEDVRREVALALTATEDFELAESGEQLVEVVVTGEVQDANVSERQMSVERLDMRTIQKMPALLGEKDVLRSIQLLPGVTSVGEGAAGFNVRGGSIDQNLVLLDEAPVYNSSHLFGFFSVFNPDAVKGVELYKGGIPARFGGRLSSILDVRMREGNNKGFQADGGIGTIFSRLSLEAPIVKDRSSFLVAGRRSYIDILAQPFLPETFEGTRLSFYDLTLKTNYRFSDRDQVFLSGYFGRDVFGLGNAASFDWGNATATLRWNHLFTDRLFANVTAYYSDYDYAINFGGDRDGDNFDWDASIVNNAVKPELTWYLRPDNAIRFGGQAIHYRFEPANAVAESRGETIDISLTDQRALESAAFAEHEVALLDEGRLKLNYGLRASHFAYLGGADVFTFGEAPVGRKRPLVDVEGTDRGEVVTTYFNLEPRASAQFQLDRASSLKASYQRTAQYIHLLSNTVASIPLDLWTPSTNNVRPQLADQVALGYFRNFAGDRYEFSVETYYKDYRQLVEYIDGADLQLNQLVEGELVEGDGRAYGAELQLRKAEGRFSGWVAYTLARTERLVPGVNNGAYYPTRFDQLHNLSVTAFYDLRERLTASANFVYNTGTPITLPTSGYSQLGGLLYVPNVDNQGRNNRRLPDYHRLDLAVTLDARPNKSDGTAKRFVGQWVFSAYNVYGRRNPFNISTQQREARPAPGQTPAVFAEQLAVVGSIVPAVSYNFTFK